MGDINPHRDVLLVAAISSQFDDAFGWAKAQMETEWGPVQFESPRFEFTETRFYAETMGEELSKQFFAFRQLIDPASLASVKIRTNDLENTYLQQSDGAVIRPVNIDPGYLTEAKLVLATTKDRDHRIYLQQGIFAEVTLHYHRKMWQKSRWTYPDYQREDFHAFFSRCRDWLRAVYRA